MPAMLDRIAAHLQFRVALAEKVRSALLYPSIVIATSLAVVAFLVIFILPTFLQVFSQFDLVLPLPTRVLVFVSNLVRHWWVLHLLIIVTLWGYARNWLMDPLHTKIVHSLQLEIPYLGPLVRNIVMTRILRTLGALVEAGVPIIRSLHLAGDSAGNVVFHDLLVRVQDSVAQGKGLAASLGGSLYVPPTVIGMIATGEKTGTIPEVLKKVADFYESETDSAIRNLFAVIEPVFVLVLGVLVGGIAVSILLPIFQLSEGFK
jgi:type IV pilus assembly protein PilC